MTVIVNTGSTLTVTNVSSLAISGSGDLNMGPGSDVNFSAGAHIKDGAGNILFSADGSTGQRMSTPFLSVPMVPNWAGGGIRNAGDGIGEYLITASNVTAETELWKGIIPQALHPNIAMRCVIGRASGATSTPTYRFYVNGTLVDTFSTATFSVFDTGQLDIFNNGATVFGTGPVGVSFTIQASVTSADQLVCTCVGVFMCGH